MFRALMSVSDKTGIVDFARGLQSQFGNDLQIISTGGTRATLEASNIPAVSVESVTRMPEMMSGRLKTLHPKLFGGILARRDIPSDMEQLKNVLCGREIHLVVVNLYPFAEVAADSDAKTYELIEQIDIGGPSLIRAAAKNFRHVLTLIDPNDYTYALQEVLPNIWWNSSLRYRHSRAVKVFEHMAAYDSVIARELARVEIDNNGFLSRKSTIEPKRI